MVITPNSTNPSGGGWSNCNSPTSGGWAKCFCSYDFSHTPPGCGGAAPPAWRIDFTDKADMYLKVNNIFAGNIATGFWPDACPFGVEYPLDKLDNLSLDVDVKILQASYSGQNIHNENISRYAIVMAVKRTNGPNASDGSNVFYTELDFWDSNTAALYGTPYYVASNINATNPYGTNSMQGGGAVDEYKADDWENRPLNQWKHFHIDFLPYINSTLKFLTCPTSKTCTTAYDRIQNGTGIHAGDKLAMVYVAVESMDITAESEVLVANFSVTANGYCYMLSKTITNAFSNGVYDPVADVNKDCVVDTHDSIAWARNSDNETWCYQKLNDNTPCSTNLTQSVTPASGAAAAPVTPTFICNYTGSTGTPVTGATVNVTIDSNVYVAAYNPSTGDYRYSGLSLTGGHQWYCNTSKTNYAPQTGTTQLYISLPSGCDVAVDSLPFIIHMNNTVYCLVYNTPTDSDGILFTNHTHNTTLDCRGFTLAPSHSPQSNSVGVDLAGGTRNNTIKNCNIATFDYGIFFEFSRTSRENTENNIVINTTVSHNNYGFYLDYGTSSSVLTNNQVNGNIYGFYTLNNPSNNTIKDSKIQNNAFGIYIYNMGGSPAPNLVYNNLFNNTQNLLVDSYNTEYWNTTKTPGTNIIGGPYIGGNYWSDYNGNDTNGDGLGDTNLPYNSGGKIATGGDSLPLLFPTTFIQSVYPASGTQYTSVLPTFTCWYYYQNAAGTAPIPNASVFVTVDGVRYNTIPMGYFYSLTGPTLSTGSHTWYCNASAPGYQSQTGSIQTYTVLQQSGGGGGGGGGCTYRGCLKVEPTEQMPVGNTWTLTVVLIAIIGLVIGYFILREALYTSVTRKRKRK
jgi:hypothetical protein